MGSTTARARRDAPATSELPPTQRERRARIVASALELLGELDYDDIHMRHVADRAGVALGTLYRYFPAKERLFAAVLVEWATRFARGRAPRGDTPADPVAATRAVLRAAVTAFERNPHFLTPVMALQSSADPIVAECYAQYAATTTRVLRDAAAVPDPVVADAVELLLLSALTMLLRQWSLGQCTMADVRRRLDACCEQVVGTGAAGAAPVPEDLHVI